MNRHILLIVALINATICFAQQPYVVGQSSGMFITPLHDSLHSGLHPNTPPHLFKLDLDNNGQTDLTFSSVTRVGGNGGGSDITLFSQDSTSFAADSTGLYRLIITRTDSLGQKTYDTTYRLMMIATKHEAADTIHPNARFQEAVTYIAYSGYAEPASSYRESASMLEWVSGTHYVVIRKIYNGNAIYGWVKIEVRNSAEILFKELALNAQVNGFEEKNMQRPQLYPNPTGGTLHFTDLPCKDVMIIDMQGRQVYSEHFEANTSTGTVQVDQLARGIYIVKFRQEDHTVVRKIVKQ